MDNPIQKRIIDKINDKIPVTKDELSKVRSLYDKSIFDKNSEIEKLNEVIDTLKKELSARAIQNNEIVGNVNSNTAIRIRDKSFNSTDIKENGENQICIVPLTCTLEQYENRPEGFGFMGVATGGEVTFAGVFLSSEAFSKVAKGDTFYVVRAKAGWHVVGTSS